jgi:hypothetical protein
MAAQTRIERSRTLLSLRSVPFIVNLQQNAASSPWLRVYPARDSEGAHRRVIQQVLRRARTEHSPAN